MTRKDSVKLASALHEVRSAADQGCFGRGVHEIAAARSACMNLEAKLYEILSADNPRFDARRFSEAAA